MKIALLFPGYGSQRVGMGKEFYNDSRIMQEYFEEAENCLNLNFVKITFASSDLDLSIMSNAYPAQFVLCASLFAMLKEESIMPSVVAGYNFGTYAALFAARGMSFPDGLYLLHKYAALYQEALHALPSVQIIRVEHIPLKKLEKWCATLSNEQGIASIACMQNKAEYIISGVSSAVDALKEKIEAEDGKVHELPIEFGLHSSLLDTLLNQFKMYLEKVDFKDLEIPLLHPVTAQAITTGTDAKQMVLDLIHKPLDWVGIIDALADYDMVIQMGCGTDLADQARAQYPEKKIVALNKPADLDDIKKIISEYKNGI
jgi:[acyl-carrier-protein] S-malonyltransferase